MAVRGAFGQPHRLVGLHSPLHGCLEAYQSRSGTQVPAKMGACPPTQPSKGGGGGRPCRHLWRAQLGWRQTDGGTGCCIVAAQCVLCVNYYTQRVSTIRGFSAKAMHSASPASPLSHQQQHCVTRLQQQRSLRHTWAAGALQCCGAQWREGEGEGRKQYSNGCERDRGGHRTHAAGEGEGHMVQAVLRKKWAGPGVYTEQQKGLVGGGTAV